jgi:hypothetical protein
MRQREEGAPASERPSYYRGEWVVARAVVASDESRTTEGSPL